MNYANKLLCKELFELTGWKTPTGQYYMVAGSGEEFGTFTMIPLYDLGFLQRKLRNWLNNGTSDGDEDALDIFLDENPEDAACSYAIVLVKDGQLKL